MSPRSSLLKRAIAPLLAVATALCAPANAATASFNPCGVQNPGTPYVGIRENVDCNFTGNAVWSEADCHCTLLGGNGANNFEIDDKNVNKWCGIGDYFYSAYFGLSPTAHGTYNCWAVGSGTDYYNNPWNASTGGTYYVSY